MANRWVSHSYKTGSLTLESVQLDLATDLAPVHGYGGEPLKCG